MSKRTKLEVLGVAAAMMFTGGLAWAQQTSAAELPLAKPGGAAPVVYAAGADAALTRAAALWTAFFKERGFAAVAPLTPKPGELPKLPSAGAVFAFETEAACPLAKEIKLDLSGLKDARGEAHRVTVREWRGRPLALVVGKTAAGTDAGAHFLLSKIACDLNADGQWTATCAPLETSRSPFFRGREATLCPTGRVVGNKPDGINYETWDRARLEAYPAYLKACGFNSIQLMELITYHAARKAWQGGYRGGTSTRTLAQIQDTLYTLADAAHANGMTVSQYIWGSPADGLKWPAEGRKEFYCELAKRYGKKVDHIITHWVDEGHEPGYETPLSATMFIWKEYQKHNPNVKVTCDSWFNPGLYQGIGDEKYATRDVAIAIERWYDARRADQILAAGRKVGIWGWYLSDFEMTFGSHLYTKTLDRYFAALPEKAGEQVEWMSLEQCFHALPSGLNLYVVGRKMWETRAPPAELVTDYCRAVFGPANAEIMSRVYAVVEAGQREVRYGMVQNDRYPVVLGTTEFKAQADAVLAGLATVKLPAGWKPNFAMGAEPQALLTHLREQVERCARTPVKPPAPQK